MPVRFSRFKTFYNYPVNTRMVPLADAGQARTRRHIPNINQHLHTRAVHALNKANAHFKNALTLLENRNTRDMRRKLARLRKLISQGNLYLQTGKNMAQALHQSNLRNRAVQINKKASQLRPRRYTS